MRYFRSYIEKNNTIIKRNGGIEPTITPSLEVSLTPTITPTATPTVTSSITPSLEVSLTPTATPTVTSSITPTVIPTATPTTSVTPTVTSSITPTITSTATPTVTTSSLVLESPTATPTNTVTPTVTPTISLTPSITPTNTVTPTITPSSITSIDVNCVTSTNAPTYLTIPTYDGSNELVHPDIYYNATGWNGYKYWMVMTPYPLGNNAYENPSIVVSNDGDIWEVPSGLTNPIVPKPLNGYNSDPNIFVGYDNKMWIVYRETNASDIFYVKSSDDGITWSNSTQILTSGSYIISPTIIMENNQYVMYYTEWGSGALKRRTADVVIGPWSAAQTCTITGLGVGRYAWHVNVEKYQSEYHMTLISSLGAGGSGAELNFGVSANGIDWVVKTTPIIDTSVSGWDNSLVYQGTMVLKDNATYDLWYSAMNTTSHWHVGRTTIDLTC